MGTCCLLIGRTLIASTFSRLRTFGMESELHVEPVLDPDWASGQAGVITLLHNIIIAGDDHTRAWFAQYLKCMQQKVNDTSLQPKPADFSDMVLCSFLLLVSTPQILGCYKTSLVHLEEASFL